MSIDKKLTIDDIVPVLFTEEQMQYFKDLKQLYQQDFLATDPLEYDPTAKYSHLQLHLVSIGSYVQFIEMLLNTQEVLIEEDAKNRLMESGEPELIERVQLAIPTF